MARALLRTLVVTIGIAVASTTARGATVTVVNNDGAGEGFNDPTPVAPVGGNTGTTLGAQRLIALQFAADIWGGLVNSAVEIRIGATFDALTCSATSATLGQAGPATFIRDFAGAPVAGTWYPVALANAIAGTDLDPGTDDIDAQFNSSVGFGCAFPGSFYLGLDANPPGVNDSDLVTVALHELCHGLGFLTLVDITTGALAPPTGLADVFTLDLENHGTGVLWPAMTDGQRLASSTDTGNLHWVGAGVVTLGVTLGAGRDPGSGHVQMFAPSPAQPGSSVSHFDTALAPDEVMEPIYTGPNHNPGLAAALLADLGWSVATLPSTTVTTTVTSTTSTSTTVTLPPGLDTYACDKAAVNTKAGGVKFSSANLPMRSLADEFSTRTCAFKKEDRICPPTLPATNPAIHELSYVLKCPGSSPSITIGVADGIFAGTIVVQKPVNVLAPSGKIDLGPVPPAPPQTVPPAPPAAVVDHYLCYKVKGPKFKPPLAVAVSDQFYPGGYPSPTLSKMTKFCTPVNKAGEDPTAPSHLGHLTCYAMKIAKGTTFAKTYVSTNNANFGAQVLKVSGVAEVCVPALRTF